MGLCKIGAGDVKLSMVMAITLGNPAVLTALLGMSGSLLVVLLNAMT